ncbi:MAG: TetR/AcrR family transcriptional regulator [Baekduiaceae bacterium]
MSETQTQKRRPGGRSARVREAVLQAALDQLLRGGYDALSIPEVARTAGVAESTVYRRWPTNADLAAAALGELAAAENPVPDTGSLEGDLHALLAQILELLRRPEVERIVRAAAAVGHGGQDADLRAIYWRTRFAGSSVIVTRAIDRGEVPQGTDPEGVIEFLVGPVYLRLLLTGRPLDDDLLVESVRRTLTAYLAT